MNILPTADDIQCREMTFTGKLQLNQLQKRAATEFETEPPTY